MKTLHNILLFKIFVLLIAVFIGCHRSYYRRQADADAAILIEEKTMDPHWSLPNYSIDLDPRSRMFDPFSLDHPPMPSDDPTAAELMRTVDGKPGYPHWHANGDTSHVANPEWIFSLPVDEEGKLTINMDQALELALIHSPEYQRQMENVYLSALDVSLERFGFETQIFAPFNSTLTSTGRVRNGGSSSTTLQNDNGVGTQLRKAGITGSSLVAGFANSLLWEYSGSDSHVGFGALSFQLIQPLLQNAGRDVILESLTDKERGLLYNVRQLERYRRGYAQLITTGISAGESVSRGSGSIANVSGITRSAGGLLGLVQTQQDIRIQEANIVSQRSLIEQFEEFFDSERIELLQLAQFRNNLYRSQSNLLDAKAGYQSSLDTFKIQLGLPPELDVEIRDPVLDQFVLIDNKITNRLGEVSLMRKQASDLFVLIADQITLANVRIKADRETIIQKGGDIETDLSWTSGDIEWTDELRDRLLKVRESLENVKPIYERIETVDFPQTEADIEKLSQSLSQRRRSLEALRKKVENQSSGNLPVIEEKVYSTEDLKLLVPDRTREFLGGKTGTDDEIIVNGTKKNMQKAREELKDLLRTWDLIIANNGKFPESVLNSEQFKAQAAIDPSLNYIVKTRAETIKRFISEPGPEILTILNNLIIDVSLIQALARVDSLTLPVVDIEWEQALEIARENRRDWMNARGQLVDQWRNIEITADSLEAQLDLTFNGDLRNNGDNISRLRDTNGRIQVGLQFDAPITRLAQRNTYREAQITYQRTKRTYYQFEDRIASQLREIVRRLEVARLNFEVSRQQVKIAVDSVQLASYNLVRPPAPGSSSNRLGPTVARDLIQALGELQGNQSSLIRNWVVYEVLRRQLDLHMGTMQLDDRGLWVDPIEITAESIRGRFEGEYIPGLSPQDATVPERDQTAPGELMPEQLNPGDMPPLSDGSSRQRSNEVQWNTTNSKPGSVRIDPDYFANENRRTQSSSSTSGLKSLPDLGSPARTGQMIRETAAALQDGGVNRANSSEATSDRTNRQRIQNKNRNALYNSSFDSDRERGPGFNRDKNVTPGVTPRTTQRDNESMRDENVSQIDYQEPATGAPPRIAPIPSFLKKKTSR